MLKKKQKVSPTASAKSKQASGNMLVGSVSSLTPSQLDSALMEMLNIRQDESGFCQANPITKAGKRNQLLQIIGVTLIPIIVLLCMVGVVFANRLQDYNMTKEVRASLFFSLDVAELVHNLQKERDISALYVSAISSGTKANLVRRYALTDVALEQLASWAVRERNNLAHFKTKEAFHNFLNKHRYELDSSNPTQKSELTFYTDLTNIFTRWFYDAITEAQTGSFWKQLVALQETMEAKEMFGLERAFGSIYFIRGGFSNREDYLVFVESQDVANATLKIAREYSQVVEDVYQSLVSEEEIVFEEIIRPYRYEIRENPFPLNQTGSEETASFWFENMTLYMDSILLMQKELSARIYNTLVKRQTEDERVLIILGLSATLVIVVCPVILNAVYSLSCEIQRYSASLADRTKALNKEKKRTDSLLYQMLPRGVAEKLKNNQAVNAESFTDVTILFSDIVGFTGICTQSSPIQVVQMLDDLYTCFDDRIKLYDVYKVETIGDAYMVASGLPNRNGKRHAAEIATLSLDLVDRINQVSIPHIPSAKFRLRIGCHTGPAVAGVVGVKMPHYCVFGETVVIASRMEQSGVAGKVHISSKTYAALNDLGGFVMEVAKTEMTKNKFTTYWLVHRKGMKRFCHTGSAFENGRNDSHGSADSNEIEEHMISVIKGSSLETKLETDMKKKAKQDADSLSELSL